MKDKMSWTINFRNVEPSVIAYGCLHSTKNSVILSKKEVKTLSKCFSKNF